jgi:hypothetical protein
MGMCAPHLSWSVRQMRGTAPAQIPGAKISVCHGVGGMFAASGTIIMSNEPLWTVGPSGRPTATTRSKPLAPLGGAWR